MLFQRHSRDLTVLRTVFYYVESAIGPCTKERDILMGVESTKKGDTGDTAGSW